MGLNNGTILIADDSLVWRNLMARHVRGAVGEDHPVEIFEDGAALEERLIHGPIPALVITDNQMPGISGSEIIKKYAPHYATTKFILHSAGDNFIGEYLVERDLAYSFIPKGSVSEEIVNRIRFALGYEIKA